MINLEITIIMKTKIAVKIAIAVTCTIAFMMGFFIKLNQFRIQSNRYSNGSIISPPFRLYYITLSVKKQLYFSAQDYRSNSVCEKRNFIGRSPLHCEAHHLHQRCNIVHLCPPCGGMMLSQGSNDVTCVPRK